MSMIMKLSLNLISIIEFWLIDGVIKYHRTIATILNALIDIGFKVERVLEPTAIKEAENLNKELQNERRRPPFLIIKAEKK
jgi:hypothetical protein